MDIFTMLQNATIFDQETDEVVGQAVGFEVINGRMMLTAVMFADFTEDGDDGEKESIPESENVSPLRAVAGEKTRG